MCYASLAPDSSGTQILVPIRRVLYFKPVVDVHMTEMMIYDWSMIIAYVLTCFLVVIYLQITNSSFTLLSDMFIFGTRNFHSICDFFTCMVQKNWRQKPVPENGLILWHWFLEHV